MKSYQYNVIITCKTFTVIRTIKSILTTSYQLHYLIKTNGIVYFYKKRLHAGVFIFRCK